MFRGQKDLLKSEGWSVEFLKALRHYGNKALRRNSSYCPIALSLYCLKRAFTLAEVLITLAVIGVIAAVTMPVLMTNINERVNSERQANIVYKITQAMEHMRALGKLTAYDSTESFVDELQKHLKVAKRCDNEHIAECWPVETVTKGDGEEFNIADAKTAENLSLTTGTNNVGLILADGASIILNYDASNPNRAYDIGDKVEASSIGLPVGNNKSKVFEYTTSVTRPVAFIMDVNGKKGPNSEKIGDKYKDIRNFGGARLANACAGDKYNGTCIYYVGTSYTPINCNDSNGEQYSYCSPTPSTFTNDYWAGAKAKCAGMGMRLPEVSELQAIYRDWNANHSRYPSITAGWFWSSEEGSDLPQTNGRGVHFSNGSANGYGKVGQGQVLCLGE